MSRIAIKLVTLRNCHRSCKSSKRTYLSLCQVKLMKMMGDNCTNFKLNIKPNLTTKFIIDLPNPSLYCINYVLRKRRAPNCFSLLVPILFIF